VARFESQFQSIFEQGAQRNRDPRFSLTRMRTPRRAMAGPLLLVTPFLLAGCWSAPTATVQPRGEFRLIQGAIAVQSVKPPAVIQSIDPDTHVITVLSQAQTSRQAQTSPVTYKVSPAVRNLSRLQAGDEVRATVAEELTVYVLRDGQNQPSGTDGSPQTVDARVLSVDRSYRLLTLRFPIGYDETFKVSGSVKLDEMEAGDAVSIIPVEMIALRRKK
jgi:hypothetical protein